jgi:hypothetical protein
LEKPQALNADSTIPRIVAELGDPDLEALITLRSGVTVYRRYRINRLELMVLKALSGFQRYMCAGIVNQTKFVETVTGAPGLKRKIEGALLGLSRRGFIGAFEYINRPGSISICVSDLGRILLKAHNEERAQLGARYGGTFERKHEFNGLVYQTTEYESTVKNRVARYKERRGLEN